ncbi:AMP-binding protein [Dactylosporangium sp. CA-139114]|uniref:AMP-binding protein n=1 Tax=Dactylosporangium sp. CA-139114 TaxID=3239931 RepID=UPI003D9815A8
MTGNQTHRPAEFRRTVTSSLAELAARRPDDVAVAEAGGAELTYAAWHDGVARVAARVSARVAAGSVVACRFADDDGTGAALAVLGTVAAGCVALPLSDRFPPPIAAAALERYGARLAIAGDGRSGTDLGVPGVALADLLAAPAPDGPGEPLGDLAGRAGAGGIMIYTSGTTGEPRSVLCDQDHLREWLDPRRHRDGATGLHPFPFDTSGGVGAMLQAAGGSPAVHVPPLVAARFDEALRRYRPSRVTLVPAQVRALLRHGAPGSAASGGVRRVVLTSGRSDAGVIRYVRTRFAQATVTNSYSSTEAGIAATHRSYPPLAAGGAAAAEAAEPGGATCVGHPDADTEVRIHSAGRAVPAGQEGDVWLRAIAAPSRRYADAAGSEVFSDGWVRTGDRGYLDGDGALFLTGRTADLIDRGGINVAAAEVEAALCRHPAVLEAAVVGLPAESLGERIAAAVVTSEPVAPADLRRSVAGHLGELKAPDVVVALAELPLNAMCKVDKGTLRELLAAAQAEPAGASGADSDAAVAAAWSATVAGEDFFDAGGDSYTAIRLAALIQEATGVAVDLMDVYEFCTAEALAAEVGRRAAEARAG